MLRHSVLACLFVSALTLSRPPDRVDAPIPEPIARFSAPRTAAQTPPLDPELRSAVARVFPISTERTRGEVMVALPLHQGVDVQVGVRVDVEDQVDAWKVNGTPTFGFEIRF